MRDIGRITISGLAGVACLLLAHGSVDPWAQTPVPSPSPSMPREHSMHEEEAGQEEQTHGAPQAPVARRRERPLLSVVDQQDIARRHRIIADDTLRAIHHECRTQLRNFYVRYDNPEHRGLGGATTIILSGHVPEDEFRALLIHECGHVIDTGAWTGTAAAGKTSFYDGREPVYADDPSLGFYEISWRNATQKKTGVRAEDFVSGYAATNAFEDFAESFAFFTLHRDAFYERALENASLMRKYVWLQEHLTAADIARSEYVWDGVIPWDITRLPFRWIGDAPAEERDTPSLVPLQ